MRSVYVHLPFCLRKCPYCSFFSASGKEDKMEAYIKRVQKEAFQYDPEEVKSIYFGGGTPTSLPPAKLSALLKSLLNRFPCGGEITIEANPATVTKESLSALRKAGFNRISIGVQSLSDDDLMFLERLHNAKDAVKAIEDAKEAGFDNISADVMFGLPSQTPESVSKTVQKLLSLPITHISTYSLSIEEGTPFAARSLSLPSEESERKMYRTIGSLCKENGFIHYEISNFAKAGYESVHNTNYWECGEYIGLGAGAHGFYEGVRYANMDDIDAYINAENPISDKTVLTETDRMEEHYMLGLRMQKGVKDDGNPNIPRLIRDGLLRKDGESVRLTERGLDIANYVICELFT